MKNIQKGTTLVFYWKKHRTLHGWIWFDILENKYDLEPGDRGVIGVSLWPHLMTLLILWRSERSSWRALSSSLNNSRFDFFFSTCIEMNCQFPINFTLTGDGKVLVYRYCRCVFNFKKETNAYNAIRLEKGLPLNGSWRKWNRTKKAFSQLMLH